MWFYPNKRTLSNQSPKLFSPIKRQSPKPFSPIKRRSPRLSPQYSRLSPPHHYTRMQYSPKQQHSSPLHDKFKECGLKTEYIDVPHVKYTLHRKPIIIEQISKQTKYRKVPITYEYDIETYPVDVIKKPCKQECCNKKSRCN